jgi:hypothetical protein
MFSVSLIIILIQKCLRMPDYGYAIYSLFNSPEKGFKLVPSKNNAQTAGENNINTSRLR